MSRFRTKPFEIEATQWFKDGDHPAVFNDDRYGFMVQTRQGAVRVDPGDWIITLADGETYPCKPDVFAAKYKPDTPAPVTADDMTLEAVAKVLCEKQHDGLNTWEIQAWPKTPVVFVAGGGSWKLSESKARAIAREYLRLDGKLGPGPLVWSSDRPKTPGRYWMRPIDQKHIVAITEIDWDDLIDETDWFDEREFAGPIPEPQEPKP
jgi:hypothetical protein